MAKDSPEQVRDDNLRLLLSKQEAGYIQDRLLEARSGIRINAIATCCGLLYLLSYVGLRRSEFWPDIAGIFQNFAHFGGFVAAVTAGYGVVCLAGAWMSMARYKSYQEDHEKFLKHYHRRI